MNGREPEAGGVGSGVAPRWVRVGWAAENAVLGAVLATAVTLPVVELVLRAAGRPGIVGAASLVQHTTLWIGMLGGAVAARQGRLLGFGGLTAFLGETARARLRLVAGGMAAGLAALLAWGAWVFVESERGASARLAFGVPAWVAQLPLVLGFAAIAARLALRAGRGWGRAVATLLAAGVVAAGVWAPGGLAGVGLWVGLGAVLAAAVCGAPIFAVLGGVTIVLLGWEDLPLATIPLKHYSLVTNPTLPSVPLFTLAGYFLAEGGASRRLVRVFQALFGGVRGGPAVVTALVCAFFTSFTGASGVTILALGGLLLPVLLAAKMPERPALGLLTSAGSIGLLFPPCLPLILYAVIAGTTLANLDSELAATAGVGIEHMFLGGLLPGLLLVGVTAWWGIWRSPREAGETAGGGRRRFEAREAWRAVCEAKWELALPVVALGALFGGFATPVEAAALTAVYACGIEWLIYRDLRLRRDFGRIAVECGLLVGGVLLILGVAMGFTHWLVMAEVPAIAVEWATEHLQSKWVFLLLLNVFLLLVGMLMDIFSATVVIVPLILPIGLAFGVDPVHLGIIFLANLELGYLTPPVGMNLFLASYRFDRPLGQILRAVGGLFPWRAAAVLAITYLPWLSTWLPSLLR